MPLLGARGLRPGGETDLTIGFGGRRVVKL